MPRVLSSSWVVLLLSLTLGACAGNGGDKDNSSSQGGDGGTGGDPGDEPGDDEDGGGDPPGMGGGGGDGGSDLDSSDLDGQTGGDAQPDSGGDGAVTCKTECDPDDCGELVSNRCGGFLHCQKSCPEGQGCGLLRPDKCDMPPSSCTPKSATEVCANKCGVVSDGCSQVYVCGADNGGISCGSGQRCMETEGDPARNTCVTASTPTCTPRTCAEQGASCGPTSDGCGNILDCTALVGCPSGKVCGIGANSGQCVDPPPPSCTPGSAATLCAGTCGQVDNGCGTAVIDCEADAATRCPSGQTCGGGGTPGQCGSGTPVCTKFVESAVCTGKCGQVGDGCGGIYNCNASNGGDVCDPLLGEECVMGTCTPPVCVAKTFQQACPATGVNRSCGVQPNGCGGTIDCGGCNTDQVCGLSTPSICGTLPSCQPASCAGKCGTMADGCGGTITCNGTNGGVTCTGAEFCGATQPNQCGTPPVTCTPRSCNDLHHTCGLATDGCGHGINCWSGCSPTDLSCTGSCGTNNTCLSNGAGEQSCVAGTPTCVGSLCSSVPTSCAANAQTKLTGTVKTPGRESAAGTRANQLPVPNALVYIPADPSIALPAIMEGVEAGNAASCGRCSDEKLVADGQSVLAAAVTNYKGEFTLEGRIPVGVAFKLVIKIGKWRRVVQIPANVAVSCQSRALDAASTRLARNSTDGLIGTHLPKIAISTGSVDEMECVFRAIGIDEKEFGVKGTNASIHMYRANGARMKTNSGTCTGNYDPPGLNNTVSCTSAAAPVNGNGCAEGLVGCTYSYDATDVSVADSDLYTNQSNINAYDLVVWDCEGAEIFEGRCANNTNAACGNDGNCRFCSNGPDHACSGNSGCRVCSNDSTRFCTGNGGCQNGGTCLATGSPGTGTCSAAPPAGTCTLDNPTRVRNYVDAGGRMFASHFSYIWIENNGTLDGSAEWGASGSLSSAVGYISMPSGTTARTQANGVKSPLMRDWLRWQGALDGTTVGATDNPATPQFTIDEPRDRAGATAGVSTDEWVYRDAGRVCSNKADRSCNSDADCKVCDHNAATFCSDDGDCSGAADCDGRVCSNDATRLCTSNAGCQNGGTCGTPTCLPSQPNSTRPRIQQLSFNTPYGAAESAICGRVAYSGFHVADSSNSGTNSYFPGVCDNSELSTQEKILAFMLFDLATCVSAGDPPTPPSCTPKTAAQVCPGVNDACGYIEDGCGGVVDCGGCASGFYCDGTTCRTQQCTPATCASLGFNCGTHADGCGGFARNAQGQVGCGDCTGGQLCGLGGAGLCGGADCTPIPVLTACPPNSCGIVSNGCGGTYNCGSCVTGQVCGAGGPNQCGTGTCPVIPKATACANKNCGFVSDGCGGSYECGTCVAPDTCGGGGQANVCGHPQCTPYSKDQACAGKQCGWVSDGCGAAINCGTCPGGGVCGGAGPNLCGSTCTITTCNAKGAECGAIADECGGVLNCGSCPSGQTCGAGGPNKCGTGQTCTPRSCQQAGAQCGLIGDGCGNVLDCGICTMPGETCGGAGQANQCGTGTGGCNKLTCEGQNVDCGAASDGCGGLLDCGGCPSGYTCKMSQCELLPPILL